MSLRNLETQIGASPNTSSNWKKTVPMGETVLKVANYFMVTTDYLLGNSELKCFCEANISEDIFSILMTCKKMGINNKVTIIVNKMIAVLMESEV